MTLALEDLRRSPNPLAVDYSAFRVGERLLLTGHSHQAWPDVARDGQVEAFEDAAQCVDDKWERAFERAERVRDGFRALLHEPGAELALAQNTHELVTRMLSALDLAHRPRLVASDGEFHTLRRQLARLAEHGIEVVRVPAQPAATLADRIAAEIDDRTSAALVSAVLFETAHVVPGLGELAQACAAHGAELVVDVYHALGVVEFDVAAAGLQEAWVVGGGYKYLQLGEGNCFMRLPPQAERLRPVLTGWFAEFGTLAGHHDSAAVEYGPGATRFAGSTYDPTSHYRAARVLRFHAERGLGAPLLQASYRHQVGLLGARFDALGLAPELIDRDRETPPERIGGFLALRTPRAGALQRRLAELGVQTDSRADYLRLGPAPYLSDAQLEEAVERLGEAARTS